MVPTTALRIDGSTLAEVCEGLKQRPKRLPCKLFYDERGAALFEQICRLPEYYPTRTERAILQRYAPRMAEWIGTGARVIELGSGSGDKTRILLRNLVAPAQYMPIDIARAQLQHFARSLAAEFPALRVDTLCADYTRPFVLPAFARRTIVFFPGSTIGNFEPGEAIAFLRHTMAQAGENAGLLIGVDLRKERSTIERAYNDAAGVTAAFNRNILAHINDVCGAAFDLAAFEHHAFYNETRGRIEMHLRSTGRQTVQVGAGSPAARSFNFEPGEPIITEYSYKYSIDEFTALARAAALRPAHVWTDERRRFGVFAFDRALSCR